MTYQVGTFFVRETGNDMYQICYMIGWSTNPEKQDQPSALVESACTKYLRLSQKQYQIIMTKFGAEYKVLFRLEHNLYERGEMFFNDKEQAEAAADWANARITELKFTGKEYVPGEELRLSLRPIMPTLIPKSQITPMPLTPLKGNKP